MNLKKIPFLILILIILTTVIVITQIVAQENKLTEDNYIIYSVKNNEKISIAKIAEDFKGYDVIIFGEEHNDAVAHYLEHLLLINLFDTYGNSLVLSLEMFESDVQMVLDEYLSDKISEQHFKKDARIWGNYKDYRPMVEFSKENKLDVIAANAPFRYANMANTKGQESLNSLSEIAKTFISPLPYDTASGDYYKKLLDVMAKLSEPSAVEDTMKSETPEVGKKPPPKMPSININQGQSLWDATMAYSIVQYLKINVSKKIMHVNGRMHSDNFFGVVQQLKNYDNTIKYLVISTFPEDSFPNTDFIQYNKLGDYIIITDPSVPKTFKQ